MKVLVSGCPVREQSIVRKMRGDCEAARVKGVRRRRRRGMLVVLVVLMGGGKGGLTGGEILAFWGRI